MVQSSKLREVKKENKAKFQIQAADLNLKELTSLIRGTLNAAELQFKSY